MSSNSSDDDIPLARANGKGLSASKISRAMDLALDRSVPRGKSGMEGLSLCNGPVLDAMDIDAPSMNGNKRKSRSSISKPIYKDASESDDAAPLAKRKRPNQKAKNSDSDDEPISKSRSKKLPPSYKETNADLQSSSDEMPLGVKLAKEKAAIEKSAAQEAKAIRAKEAKAKRQSIKEESDDDEPIMKSAGRRQSNGTAAKRKSDGVKKEESDSDVPIAKKAKTKTATAVKKTTKATVAKDTKKATKQDVKKGKGKVKEEVSEDEAEEYEWWNAPKRDDDSIKWQTLEHNGVVFAPEYEPLPKNIKMYYDGKPVTLGLEAEEVATFWVSMMTEGSKHHLENPKFRENFFKDFSEYIKKYGATDSQGNKVQVKDLDKCDFTKMAEFWHARVEAKKNKNLSKEEKAEAKAKKDALEAPYVTCMWDGRPQKVGNFRVEPPSLFRGRGDHPKTGRVKRRVYAEQITINIGKGAKVPDPPKGHKWKAVQHDQKATWLAMWQENINNAYKYVMLGVTSDVKGQSDFKKFEKARELKKHIDKIRKDYIKDLTSTQMADRQRATAMYFIDRLALRAGNEKDTENEADTVGCCSLKFEHITLTPAAPKPTQTGKKVLDDTGLEKSGHKVTFDFLGKDSIRYHQEVIVHDQVFKNLKMFKKAPKTKGDDLFDRLNTSQLNKHLNGCMPGLTAKVFRTYNASWTMSEQLKKLMSTGDPKKMTVAEKYNEYNKCNRAVAILCNHKRSVGAAHDTQMNKLNEKVKAHKYQMWRIKKMILQEEPSLKKKKGAAWFELDEDIDDEWILEHQQFLQEELRTKIEKKFQKDNEKLIKEGKKPMPDKQLKELLADVKELADRQKKENKSKKIDTEAEFKNATVDRLTKSLEALEKKVETLQFQMEDREDNKEVALGTSKINYIDPRLSVVFAKKWDVPIEKFFSKTLREKFRWAIKTVEDSDDWTF